jgi:phage tail-like protein
LSRVDPYRVFRFHVEFDHIEHGGFARARGLVRETKVDAHREGGLNEFEHKLATHTTYGNLILERGLADAFLWGWNNDVVAGNIARQAITIVLHDTNGDPAWRWVVDGAYPVKWSGTDLDGASGQVLVESIEFAHHGFHGETA